MKEIVQNDFLLQDFIFFMGKSSSKDANLEEIRAAEVEAVGDFVSIQAGFVEKKANDLFYDRTNTPGKFGFGMTAAQKAHVDKNVAQFRAIHTAFNTHKAAIFGFVGLDDTTGAKKSPPLASLNLLADTPNALTCHAVTTGPFKGMSTEVQSLTSMVTQWEVDIHSSPRLASWLPPP